MRKLDTSKPSAVCTWFGSLPTTPTAVTMRSLILLLLVRVEPGRPRCRRGRPGRRKSPSPRRPETTKGPAPWETGPGLRLCRGSGGLDVLRIALADLVHLRHGDRQAVALVRVLREEVLVVVLGVEELTEGLDLGDDPAVPPLPRALRGLLEELLLLLVRVEHRRAVLRADVVALPVQLAGVVQREEHVEDHLTRDHVGVERHGHRLRVAGGPGAHELVAGVRRRSSGVAGHDVADALEVPVHGVQAPEAATSEYERLHHFSS